MLDSISPGCLRSLIPEHMFWFRNFAACIGRINKRHNIHELYPVETFRDANKLVIRQTYHCEDIQCSCKTRLFDITRVCTSLERSTFLTSIVSCVIAVSFKKCAHRHFMRLKWCSETIYVSRNLDKFNLLMWLARVGSIGGMFRDRIKLIHGTWMQLV